MRTSTSSPFLSSSSSSSASPTPNSSSRSSQTSASAKLEERARPLPFLLLMPCGNNVDGGVSGLLCNGRSCVPNSSSSSESRARDELDPERGRYNLDILSRKVSRWMVLALAWRGRKRACTVPLVFGGSTSRDDRRCINRSQTPEDLPYQIRLTTQRVARDEERTTMSPNWKVLCWADCVWVQDPGEGKGG